MYSQSGAVEPNYFLESIAALKFPVGSLSWFARLFRFSKVNSIAAKGILKPLGLGSTGRTTAVNLVEEMAMKYAKANRELGKRIIEGMNDPRWKGWTKMEHSVETQNGVKATVHYVGKWEGEVLKAIDDFKFK